MNKRFRKVKVVFLSILMASSLMPTTAFASPVETETVVETEDVTSEESQYIADTEIETTETETRADTESDDASVNEVQPESQVAASETEESVETETEKIILTSDDSDSVLTGSCGDNAVWSLDQTSGTLTISGTGAISEGQICADYVSVIKSVVIAEGITGIGRSNFYGEKNLKTVSLPSSLTSIAYGAFAECSSLSDVEVPEGVSSIGSYAFQNCAISSITIPAGITEFNPLWFYNCPLLENINIAANNESYKSVDGVVYNKSVDTLICMPSGRKGSFAIPDTVKELGESSFIRSRLSSVIIPDSVTTFDDYVFGYSNLESVQLPDSLTSVGDCIFQNCTSLTSVSVGKGLKAFGYRFFSGCTSLTDVSLGENLEDMNCLTFAGCTSLETIQIPSKVKYIKNGTFGNCTSLKQIVLPSGLEGIWYQAFFRCSSLTSISLPDSMTEINRLAFYGSGLTSVKIPANVCLIGAEAFPENCELVFASSLSLEKQDDGSYVRPEKVTINVQQYYDMAYEVLNLVNKERAKEGLSALTMDGDLLNAAMQRAAETVISWSHTRPNGNNCFTACSKMFAENIAAGNTSAASVMNSWMNSTGHRANIMNGDFTSIGIGVVKYGNTYYWTQCFGYTKDSVNASSYKNQTASANIQLSDDNDEYAISCALAASSIKAGATTKMTVTVNNNWCSSTIPVSNMSFSTSNAAVAKVSSDGVVTGIGSGSAIITAKLKNGTYSWTAKVTVVLNNIKNCTVKMNSKVVYTGKSQMPAVTVSVGKTVLKNGTDYSIKYSNNLKVGTAKVTITGKGKYTGTVIKTFTIIPKGTEIRKVTAITKGFSVVWTAQKSQTTGYQVQYATNSKFTGAKTVTVTKNSVISQKVQKLTSKKTYYIRIRTYQKTGTGNYYSAWSKVKTIKTR